MRMSMKLALCLALCLCIPLFADTTSTPSCVQQKPKLLLIYSSRCPHSQQVLSYLRSIHKTLPMEDVLHNAEAKEELRVKGGQMIVPCLLINDQPTYDADVITDWLSKHQDLLLSSS